VEDRELWSVVKEIGSAELKHFGMPYSAGQRELKANKLLNRKVFRLAAQLAPIPPGERTGLARECLADGSQAGLRQLTALAQAKIAYVAELLDICSRFRCKAFASVVSKASPVPAPDHLRKDYAYLLERFFYYREDLGPAAYGIVVFDELNKVQSHLLLDQMDRYFKLTARGRHRSGQILPEPLFVHSDLTTGVQLADLIAYIVSWGVRFPGMDLPARDELNPLAQRVLQLRHRSVRDVNDSPNFVAWSLAYIRDLRPREEREEGTSLADLVAEDEGGGRENEKRQCSANATKPPSSLYRQTAGSSSLWRPEQFRPPRAPVFR
jgi:hypothetical protein